MCNNNIFRTLNPDEIEVRVQQVAKVKDGAKALLLLYKNARVDMDMLDEHFTCLGWQREHILKEGKNYCKVSVYDASKQMWISKEDVGVESNMEETKGEASDAFKRACVNLGIGRELYTAPTIAIDLSPNEWKENERTKKPQTKTYVKFRVGAITYNPERRIIGLSIVDQNDTTRYVMGQATQPQPQQPQLKQSKKSISEDNLLDESFLTKLCDWLNRNIQNKDVKTLITQYYTCDDETITLITKEYERRYA